MTEGQIFLALIMATCYAAREKELAAFVGLVLVTWQGLRLLFGAFGG